MNLFHESKVFIGWTARVTKKLLRHKHSGTLFVIFAISFSRIAKLLAFFLPLKVILLAGSDGVPSYFPFIEATHKTYWIIGLAVGAFVVYVIMLLLNILTDRYSAHAGQYILRVSNQMSISAREDLQAKKTFSDFTNILAGLGFVGVGALVVAWFNPILLAYLFAVPLLIFVLSSWFLRGEALPFKNTKKWIVANTKEYLVVASSTAFFGAFLVILLLFLFGESNNIILAILGIILSRQMLNSMSGIANTACGLISRRHIVDTILFRNVPIQTPGYKPHSKQFNVLFSKPERERVAWQELARVIPLDGSLRSDWSDTSLKGIKTLSISVLNGKGDPLRHFQQQIVPALNRDQLINEAHLFEHIPRERLKAPAVLTRFKVDEFECQILDYGFGELVSKTVWPQVKHELLIETLSVMPPKALVSSYKRSRPLLAERLTDCMAERLGVAVDTQAEAEILLRWASILPALRGMLASQPLCIYNVDLGPANVVRADSDYLIMAWGRWSLEPLGAALQLAGFLKNAPSDLEALQQRRPDLVNRAWQGDLELSSHCAALEQTIKKMQFKMAFSIITHILSVFEPLVTSPGNARVPKALH